MVVVVGRLLFSAVVVVVVVVVAVVAHAVAGVPHASLRGEPPQAHAVVVVVLCAVVAVLCAVVAVAGVVVVVVVVPHKCPRYRLRCRYNPYSPLPLCSGALALLCSWHLPPWRPWAQTT